LFCDFVFEFLGLLKNGIFWKGQIIGNCDGW